MTLAVVAVRTRFDASYDLLASCEHASGRIAPARRVERNEVVVDAEERLTKLTAEHWLHVAEKERSAVSRRPVLTKTQHEATGSETVATGRALPLDFIPTLDFDRQYDRVHDVARRGEVTENVEAGVFDGRELDGGIQESTSLFDAASGQKGAALHVGSDRVEGGALGGRIVTDETGDVDDVELAKISSLADVKRLDLERLRRITTKPGESGGVGERVDIEGSDDGATLSK